MALAHLHLTAQIVLSDHSSYGRADDRAGREIRTPMDSHGNSDANIESIAHRYVPHPPLFRKERENRGCHCERYRGMRGRPPPEDSAAQEAESEDVGGGQIAPVLRPSYPWF